MTIWFHALCTAPFEQTILPQALPCITEKLNIELYSKLTMIKTIKNNLKALIALLVRQINDLSFVIDVSAFSYGNEWITLVKYTVLILFFPEVPMNYDANEHLQCAEVKVQQLTAVATAAGEAAEQIDRSSLMLCFQVIEQLGRECRKHINQAEVTNKE